MCAGWKARGLPNWSALRGEWSGREAIAHPSVVRPRLAMPWKTQDDGGGMRNEWQPER